MSGLGLFRTFLRELVTPERSPRVPEPDLVMDDPEKVAAFTRAGREDGVMAPVYLYHCAHACSVIRPGDTVVDLGCGPATQLAMVARLNRDASFIGVDLSGEMLERAGAYAAEQGLSNMAFRRADITRLAEFADDSADAVMSTVVLHQLPELEAFRACLCEAARILKPGGGLYIVDFGHLKSEKSIRYFAYQYADRQPELFTIDYLNSLRAAFPLVEWRRAAADCFRQRARVFSTFLMPYMVAIKSSVRSAPSAHLLEELSRLCSAMPDNHQADLANLDRFFRLGGLANPFLAMIRR